MTQQAATPATVVLVHGAFADASSWNGVIELLLAAGVKVQAPANPLRGLAFDSAYMAGVLGQISGPVLAVGHSYGGAVHLQRCHRGEQRRRSGVRRRLRHRRERGPQRGGGHVARQRSWPGTPDRAVPDGLGDQTATELYVNPASFHEVFARDLPESQSAVLAAGQRPVAAAAFDEKSGPPAWRKLPSWAVVATGDKAAGADVILSMAQRAGAEIHEVDASHVVMISQPQLVTDVILKALEAVG